MQRISALNIWVRGKPQVRQLFVAFDLFFDTFPQIHETFKLVLLRLLIPIFPSVPQGLDVFLTLNNDFEKYFQ